MSTMTLAALFLCNLAIYSFGNGFLPLMPLYAQMLGASKEAAGYYVAFSYLCLAAGTFVGGRFSDTGVSRRGLLAMSGLLIAPLAWLLGRVHSIALLTLTTGVQWFACGICLAVVAAIAGRQAGSHERGKVFGVLGTTISLGSLVGGIAVGRLVDAWGYPAMFAITAGFMLLVPAAALLVLRGEAPRRGALPQRSQRTPAAPLVTAALILLLLGEILTMVSNGEGNMGRSVVMNGLSFDGTTITMTAAIGGIVSLPVPFLLGWLSDRMGRKPIMVASPVLGAAGLLVLLQAHSLWSFSVVAVLSSLMAVSIGLGPALVADVVRKERVGTGISLFQSSVWVGMIAGFSFSGMAFQRLGIPLGLEMGAMISLAAVPLFLLVKAGGHGQQSPSMERRADGPRPSVSA